MHTRSAEVYLDRAKSASRPDERNELLTKALEVLSEGMQADPGNPKVWFLAGQAYTRLGDAAGADSAFDHAESLYPEYRAETEPERLALWIIKYNAGIEALQEGNEAGAIELFEQADMLYRGRPDAALSLASLYARHGDLAKAEAAYRTTLEITRGPASRNLEPDAREQWMEQEATAALHLADLLTQTGKAQEALEVQRALVQRQPGNAQAKSGLAMALAAAGQQDEAARLYEQILAGDDLDEIALFNTGVGLYQAQQFELAARAFEKSLEKNARARDALYNLGQALFGAASEIEGKRDAAPEAEKAALNQKLVDLYTRLASVATTLQEIDPNHRNNLMMLAQAQRSLGELVQDEAAGQAWKEKVLATLEAAEAMPFEVSGVQLAGDDGSVTVSGTFTNLKLAPGESVALDFTLYDETGAVVATKQVTIPAPAADAQTTFSFEIATDAAIAAWSYRKAG